MRYACRCNTYCPFPRARMKGTLPKLPAAGQQPVPGQERAGPWTRCPPIYLAYTSRVPPMYLSRPESRVTCGYAWQKQADALGAIPVEAAETCPFVRWPGFAWDSRRCGHG